MVADLRLGHTRRRKALRLRRWLAHLVRGVVLAVLQCGRGAALAMPGAASVLAVCAELTLHGRRASAGRVTGRVRLVRCEDDMERFSPGDVLVAAYGSIAALACLPIAAAVVIERGGELSAAAIQARELGIPAVLGAAGALAELWNGAWVTVNGDRGTVYVSEGW